MTPPKNKQMDSLPLQPHVTSLRADTLFYQSRRRPLSVSDSPIVPDSQEEYSVVESTRLRSASTLPRSRAASSAPSPSSPRRDQSPRQQHLSVKHLSSVTALVGDLQRLLDPSLWITDQFLHQHYESKKAALDQYLEQRKAAINLAAQKAIDEAKAQFTDQSNLTNELKQQIAVLKTQLAKERDAILKVHESSRVANLHSGAVIGSLEARIVELEDLYIDSQRRLQGYEQALLYHCTESSDDEGDMMIKEKEKSSSAAGSTSGMTQAYGEIEGTMMVEPRLTASLLDTHNNNKEAPPLSQDQSASILLQQSPTKAFDSLKFIKVTRYKALNAKAIAASLAIDEAMRKFVCLDDQREGAAKRREKSHRFKQSLIKENKRLSRVVIEKDAVIASLEGQVEGLRADVSRMMKTGGGGGGFSIASRSAAGASVKSGGSTRHYSTKVPSSAVATEQGSNGGASVTTTQKSSLVKLPQNTSSLKSNLTSQDEADGARKSSPKKELTVVVKPLVSSEPVKVPQPPRCKGSARTKESRLYSVGSRVRFTASQQDISTNSQPIKSGKDINRPVVRLPVKSDHDKDLSLSDVFDAQHPIALVRKEVDEPNMLDSIGSPPTVPNVEYQLPIPATNEPLNDSDKHLQSKSVQKPSHSQEIQSIAKSNISFLSDIQKADKREEESDANFWNKSKSDAVLQIVEVVNRLISVSDLEIKKEAKKIENEPATNDTKALPSGEDRNARQSNTRRSKNATTAKEMRQKINTLPLDDQNSSIDAESTAASDPITNSVEERIGLFKVVADLYRQIQRQQQEIERLPQVMKRRLRCE